MTDERDDEILAEGKDLVRRFGAKTVLDGVSIQVRRGETLAIMGGSGHGKSTIMRLLTGLDQPNSGSVSLFGRDFHASSRDEQDEIRKRFGILFQSGALYSSMTVGENIATPIREHRNFDESMIQDMVKMKLELVGLRDAKDLMPAQLSGGMRKRIGLARAIALDPELLFCDEPTSGLDPVATAGIDQVLKNISKMLGVAIVVVSHDMKSVFNIATRVVMLFRGHIIASGSRELFEESDDPKIRQFVDGQVKGPIPFSLARKDYAADLLQLEEADLLKLDEE